MRSYCESRADGQEKRRCRLTAEEQARHGGGPEELRVTALRQFRVGPVLHKVTHTHYKNS